MKLDHFYSFSRGRMENITINDTGLIHKIRFYGGKFIYLFHRIILPVILGQNIFATLYLHLVTEATSGVFFGIFSQISHVHEDCEWPIDKPIPK